MAENTKERIMETALELFAEKGYLGTSMNDIAKQLGFTKAALYKHYTSKQEILDRIVERMNEMDYERESNLKCQRATLPRSWQLIRKRRLKRFVRIAKPSSCIGQRKNFLPASAKC